jgi:hypothetical protein
MPQTQKSSNMSTALTNPSETSVCTRQNEDLTRAMIDQLALNAVRTRRPQVTTVLENESDDEIEIIQVILPLPLSNSNQGLGAIGNMVERDHTSNPVYDPPSTVPLNITVMANTVHDSMIGTPSTGGVPLTGGDPSIEAATIEGGILSKTSAAHTPPKVTAASYTCNPYENTAPLLRSTQKTPNQSNLTARLEPAKTTAMQGTGAKL